MGGYLVLNAGEDTYTLFTSKWRTAETGALPGEGPRRICAGRAGSYYIANTFSGTVDKIDLQSGATVSAQCGSCLTGICYLSDLEKVAAVCGESNRLFLLDAETLQIEKSVPCGNFPLSVDYEATRGRIAVACLLDQRADFFNSNLEPVGRLTLPGYACFIKQEKDGSCYCSHGMEDGAGFSKFLADGRAQYCVALESFPTTAARKKGRIALAHTGGGEILILEERTGKLIRRAECFMPDDIAASESEIVVTAMGEDKIYILDWDGNVLKTKKTGKEPRGVIRLFDEHLV